MAKHPVPNELPTAVLRVSHHSPRHIAERYPYAAYGSNLLLEQMANRTKDADAITSGRLPRYKLIFAHYCSIIEDKDSNVPVGIYALKAEDVERLDRREGLGRAYDRYLVTVLADDGRAIRCFTYIKRDQRLRPPPKPYYDIVAAGYRDWKFDDRRLRHAREQAHKHYEANKDKYEAESRKSGTAAFNNWYRDWQGSQQSLPFGNVDHRTGRVRVRSSSNDDSPKSLVTGRCRKCGEKHDGACSTGLPSNIKVPRYMSVSMNEVEWGARGSTMYWRVKGSRAWYLDITNADDIKIGMVRGEIATNLPGSSAYVPKEGPK